MALALPVLDEHDRPRVRGDCEPRSGTRWSARPCRFEACRHHTSHTKWRGATESCTLDVADRGGIPLLAVGEIFGGLSRERIRQIEVAALKKLARVLAGRGLRFDDLIGGAADDDSAGDVDDE